MTRCLFVLPPLNHLVILSLFALVGGLYFFFYGFHLLARKRVLLNTPTSKIRSAALGLVEVNGQAVGPHTMPSPITGQLCFLYRTVAWQQRDGKKQEWEKLADETLHLPFFLDDSTGKLLIEPLGADLDLHCDFRQEFDASLFSSNFFSDQDGVPPRVSAFLGRHGITAGRRLRIEEHAIKPGDELFAAGTLAENPGIQLRPFAPHSVPPNAVQANGSSTNGERNNPRNGVGSGFSEAVSAPQIVKLSSGDAPSSTQEMSQQAKIAAALTRAGITRPEAWSAAGVPYQSVAVEPNGDVPALADVTTSQDRTKGCEHQSTSVDFDPNPPVVLMKGANDPTFVLSFRSQKEFIVALGWKSAAMVWGGAAIALLGIYMLMAQMELL
ncbi:MAG: hypothetical protein ABSG02_14325 [Terriglobales bacterium]